MCAAPAARANAWGLLEESVGNLSAAQTIYSDLVAAGGPQVQVTLGVLKRPPRSTVPEKRIFGGGGNWKMCEAEGPC